MQITEQIIERIARRTFNSMFAPALRQSNVVTAGVGSAVSWADNANHANIADEASTAGAAPWAGITDKPATATRWPAWSEVTDKPSTFAPSSGSSYYMTRDAWWTNGETHDANDLRSGVVFAYSTQTNVPVTGTLVAFSCRTNNNYALQLQGAYNLDTLYFRNRNGDNNTWKDWHYVIHDGNIGNQSVNYATSAGSATSATKDGDGNTISSTYLKLAGGTMTGSIIPSSDQAIDLGSSTKRWRYIYSYGMWGTSGNALRLGGNDATLMYLTSSGRCGIGTDSPVAKLGVAGNASMWAGYFNGNSQSAVYLAYSDGQGIFINSKSSSASTYLLSIGYGATSLDSTANHAFRVNADGNVGVGTNSPSQKLHVSGGLLAITNNGRTVTIGAQNSGGVHIYNDNSSPFFFNGDVCSNAVNTYDLGSTTYPWGSLYAAQCYIYATTPSVHVGTSSSARISLHWSSDNNRGLYDYTGYWLIGTNGGNTFLMRGNVGIGTTSPGTEKLKVNGSIYTTVGLFSEGYLDTLSDKRFKDVVDYDAAPSLDAIADAPAIHFKWNDREDDTMHVGSISQYWQKVMPEATHMRNGKLGMNYDVIATLNTIALAREVRELKAELAKLKQQGYVG